MRVKKILIALLVLTLVSCAKNSQAVEAGKPILALSIPPQSYFASRIGGSKIQTTVLVGQGQNPHTFEPSPRQMSDLAGAGFWVLSGAEFEIALEPKIRAAFPKLLIIDGTRGVKFRRLGPNEKDDDGDEPPGSPNIDHHTWLGEEPAKIMAAAIRDACVKLDSKDAALFNANYGALVKDIDHEFAKLSVELAPLRGRTVFVYHPAFGYFLDGFGIKQEAVETGGKEPAPKDLAALIDLAKKDKAAAIFVQAEFPVRSAQTIAAATGAVLVSLDPLAADWLANIQRMGDALRKYTIRQIAK